MYATAHLVRSASGEEAVHAFYHRHGDVEWPDDVVDWPESNPGQLVAQHAILPVGGNPVHAFLDVLAPDETPWAQVEAALESLRLEVGAVEEPVVLLAGAVTVRFGSDLGAGPKVRAVLEDLAASVARVVQAP